MRLLSRSQPLPPNSVAVKCRDVAGRHREVIVTRLPHSRIAITVPAGEVATFDAAEAEQLRAELRGAVYRAAGVIEDAGPFTGGARCADAIGRERVTLVSVTDCGRIAVTAPAGGIATFTPLQTGPLRRALLDAMTAMREPKPARPQGAAVERKTA